MAQQMQREGGFPVDDAGNGLQMRWGDQRKRKTILLAVRCWELEESRKFWGVEVDVITVHPAYGDHGMSYREGSRDVASAQGRV